MGLKYEIGREKGLVFIYFFFWVLRNGKVKRGQKGEKNKVKGRRRNCNVTFCLLLGKCLYMDPLEI